MRGKNRFLPNFDDIVPHHDTPTMVVIDATHDSISLALAQLHSMAGGAALGVAEPLPASLTINGRLCQLTGDSIDGYYLCETADHHEGSYPKIFYLMPRSDRELDWANGLVPSVRTEDTEFDDKYTSPTGSRVMRLYIMCILAKLIKR
jgi:hypothetical protein